MNCGDCDPMAFTTAVNTLAVAIARNLDEDELALLTAVLVQLTGSLTTIAVQRSICNKKRQSGTGTMSLFHFVYKICNAEILDRKQVTRPAGGGPFPH